jgi:hypothetical protein
VLCEYFVSVYELFVCSKMFVGETLAVLFQGGNIGSLAL